MKKIKKMLAGLLGAAMVLTSIGTPAWATSTKSPTISTEAGKEGSLTIYKYEYNGEETSKKEGTGEATDSSNVPNDAKPLAGVEFTIYKIADISQTITDNTTKLVYTPVDVEGIRDLD